MAELQVMMFPGVAAMMCVGPLYCTTVTGQCCFLAMDRGRLVCPISCSFAPCCCRCWSCRTWYCRHCSNSRRTGTGGSCRSWRHGSHVHGRLRGTFRVCGSFRTMLHGSHHLQGLSLSSFLLRQEAGQWVMSLLSSVLHLIFISGQHHHSR